MNYEEFIFPAKNKLAHPEFQRWADLGCGEGVFTELLAGILPFQSEIIAIDQNNQRLNPIMGNEVSVHFQQVDFEKEELDVTDLHGILMANSLHYIQDKEKLIRKLEAYFSDRKQFLIVEYETQTSNPWVPFPINFEKLKDLFHKFDYKSIEKLNTRKSAYGGEMYIAWIQFD